MSMKEVIFSMMIEALELSEAAEVSGARYFGSHGKKPRDTGQPGSWMFTHKPSGDVDVNNEKEVHTVHGKKLSDAKKSAQQWAAKNGHDTVYIMESVEQIDEISDEKKKEYIRAVADKGGILRKPRPGSLKGFDRKKDDALVKAFKGGSMQDYANLHKKSEKRAGIALNALNSLKKEEVELDEVSDQKLDAYRQKAFADQPAGDDGSDKYRKRKFGRDLAFAKQTGRAKVLATKESVELDELAIIKNNRKFSDVKRFDTDKETNAFLEKNPDHGVLHTDDGGTYVAKNKNKGAPVKALNGLKKEEVELDESWSKGASSANRSDAIAAAKHQAEADRLRKAANKLGKDNPQHNELMGDHHKAMAKFVKHSFHSGKYPSMAIAKKDYKSHIDQAKEYTAVNENYELDEADAVVTHKWYSVKNWKDGSDHFDNLDDHLRGHSYKHPALGNTAKNRPDHHIGIPVKAKSAIAYMDKHAKAVNE